MLTTQYRMVLNKITLILCCPFCFHYNTKYIWDSLLTEHGIPHEAVLGPLLFNDSAKHVRQVLQNCVISEKSGYTLGRTEQGSVLNSSLRLLVLTK